MTLLLKLRVEIAFSRMVFGNLAPGSCARELAGVWHSRQGLENGCFTTVSDEPNDKTSSNKCWGKIARDHAANPAELRTMGQNTPAAIGKGESGRMRF